MTPANSFDAVRLLAAVLVVYGHAYPLAGMSSPALQGNTVQSIAVKVFFVISGFLILGSWMRDPHVGRYAVRRVLRILPALAVVVLLSALVLGPLCSELSARQYFENARTWAYIGNNLMLRPQYDLPGLFGSNVYPVAVNGSLWSLPAEVAMYVIGPVICACGVLLRSVRAMLVVAAMVFMALAIWFVRLHPPAAVPVFFGTSVLSFLDVAPYFLLGGLYAAFRPAGGLPLFPALASCAILLLVRLPGAMAEIALYVLLPYIVLAAGTHPSGAGKLVHRYGDISYGVYLYGFPMQQVVASWLAWTRGEPWLNFLVALGPTLLFATLSWRLIESPALKLKPTGRRGAYAAPPRKQVL